MILAKISGFFVRNWQFILVLFGLLSMMGLSTFNHIPRAEDPDFQAPFAVVTAVLPGADPALWPLVCMAATLGATLGAPLTAIVFAFCLTHDSNALLPLLGATLIAHGFATVVMKRSIMTEKIARRGYHIYREYGVDPLERHYVDEVMSHDVETIDAQTTVADALATRFGATQTRRAWPVVRDGAVLGVVDRAMLEAQRKDGAGKTLGAVFVSRVPDVAMPEETCRQIATRLAIHGLERLPVVTDRKTMHLVGIVSRSDLVKLSLTHFEEEHKKERFRRIRIGNGNSNGNGRRRFPPVHKAG